MTLRSGITTPTQSHRISWRLATELCRRQVLNKLSNKSEFQLRSTAQAIDSNGNMFFVLLEPLALVCWDSSSSYTTENFKIIYQNDQTLQFASGVKVVKNAVGMEELWVLTNRFQVRLRLLFEFN